MNDKQQNIAEIEREITRNQPVSIRIFLSWQAALVAVVFGISGVIGNILKQKGYLDQFTSTEVNVVSLICIILLAYGLIALGNFDWNWGKNRK